MAQVFILIHAFPMVRTLWDPVAICLREAGHTVLAPGATEHQ